ncbi:DUF2213 domain-containing protein [Dielma fastidiosa]|uniref:DUF2213 domain-containing protein n=1 Tax=Dielma fastidiosa TaxID=1034346 RepID=UPI0036F2EFAB
MLRHVFYLEKTAKAAVSASADKKWLNSIFYKCEAVFRTGNKERGNGYNQIMLSIIIDHVAAISNRCR